jgi:hypothetical protein
LSSALNAGEIEFSTNPDIPVNFPLAIKNPVDDTPIMIPPVDIKIRK